MILPFPCYSVKRYLLIYRTAPDRRLNSLKIEMDSQILELAKIIHKSKKVVVVTGAGISTNGGIPVKNPKLKNPNLPF